MTETNGDQEVTEGPTQDDLEALRQKNQELREQIAEANSRQATAAANNEREVEMGQLLAEQVRLEAELAQANAAADAVELREGSENIMESIKSQLENATLVASQPVGPVDTNANRKSDEDEDQDSVDTDDTDDDEKGDDTPSSPPAYTPPSTPDFLN